MQCSCEAYLLNSCLPGNLPEESQKTALVTDLLYVMMGVEGEFIHPQPVVNRHAPREFLIDSSVGMVFHSYLLCVPLTSGFLF